MRSFFRGDAVSVLEELCGSNDEAFRLVSALAQAGLFHTLDKFEGFKQFETGRCIFRIHLEYSGPLLDGYVCCIRCGMKQRYSYECSGCRGSLAPTISPPAKRVSPEPLDIWPGLAIDRLDISMHKSER